MVRKSYVRTALVSAFAATGVFVATPTLAEAAFGDRTLSLGTNHQDVTTLQEILKEKGYYTHHTITGIFGDQTKLAVEAYQRDNGLAPDGVVGPKTFSLLNGSVIESQEVANETISVASQSAQTMNAQQILRAGATGVEVTKLQTALAQIGFYSSATTGSYGDATVNAVRNFQRARSLTADGIAGPQTLTQLNREISASQTAQTVASNPTVSTSSTVLRLWSEGAQVRTLQNRLRHLGFYTGGLTAILGPKTQDALRSFQRSAGITVDGLAGPQTFAAIERAVSGQAPVATPTPTPAPSQPASQLLRMWSTGEAVRSLQTTLRDLGYYKDGITATFGPKTEAAVMAFQRDNNIRADGIAGPMTFRALENGTPAVTTPPPTQTNSQTLLRMWTTGEAVRSLQTSLKNLGYYNAGITGTFGPITEAAVIAFQRDNNIRADGIAGPMTFRALETGTPAPNVPAPPQVDSSQLISILREGSTGDEVRLLQTRLKELNYYAGQISGIFGAETTSAVRQAQQAAGIKVDGVTGPQTYRALETLVPRTGNATPAPSTPTLRHGVRSNEVRELQNMLKSLGLFSGTATGFFGDVTEAAVKRFQSQWNLVADGLVTQSTWLKLEEASSVHIGQPTNPVGGGSFNVINLIANASELIGIPYLWGGTTVSGFDCSGFIQYAFRMTGKQLPRTVAEQWNATSPVSDLRVGDIVYFETYRTGPSHNGIYIGNNQFIHSGSSTGVSIASLDNSYWKPRYLGARRVN
ncbi:peptidoglycan-binding protein [Paenalkalicoccus suaedae]|uniref:Peptidoglycan-binding protein n=1 Tax=Paenalkalicoccus suaedae TaxID=2592382 RepID=A0A859FH96_9BACI|nr:peptidoglycan-binding protein [Paenalkalicoccus suaedae]QKS72733.1 peptidoglycan-binding protein [Paenalkalicoccus suaedae]